MTKLNRIVVVGASLAGLRAVQALRAKDFAGDITLIGAENHAPYNRPPLSKSVLDGDDDIALPGAEQLDGDWLRNRRATALRTDEHRVVLDDGSEVAFDGLVVATGAGPRRFPGQPAGVHSLRTVDDALALRAELAAGPGHVTVIGGGFIGSEVASTARRQGISVTLVDAGSHPMGATLGSHGARWLARHHERHGVELISGVRALGFEGESRATAVRLSDGRRIPTEVVVAGTGVEPNTDWLRESGLKLDNGVVCTSSLFADGESSIVAAGDVARWSHPLYDGALVRVEHWANANEQGALAARNLLAGPADAEAYGAVPSFATHIHGARFQVAGIPALGDEELVLIDDPTGDRLVVAFVAHGVLVGAVAVNAPKDLIRLKRAIAARASVEDVTA
ncbi:FAD-dependent oxidoreductase [Nocardia farcinica]|uniref:NAD(P)/FAD-dependent oxidoreductase n=1 Tax=Nocardia TaxID=1817 RepID=UPI0018932E82|nr:MULTISPECIES: FAD-dependent oxidoreductase [Nocardia]MBF6289934.1 FAD-dependent oxidoreductase [Nocardia cyriacigeorgica]MBF6422222.1 FAD-dependent oxidoreductase [Nocardia farcinica]MBF6433878.1 FAD-dependent oxidoreductase [Nocardia farcinica]MBF6504946.1 FAD-dependent oxidoreductase [Nocardia farcinica]